MPAGFSRIHLRLLVVIAIIDLLASVVLASLAEARERAQNAATISAIRSYITALEIYRNEHGGYPEVDNFQCLGKKPEGDSKCLGTANNGNELKPELQPYIKSWRSPNPQSTNSDYSPGSAYFTKPEDPLLNPSQKCDSDVCNEAIIFWTMENYSDDCGISEAEKKPSSSASGYWCRLDLK